MTGIVMQACLEKNDDMGFLSFNSVILTFMLYYLHGQAFLLATGGRNWQESQICDCKNEREIRFTDFSN